MNWYIQVLKKYAVFGGRARRTEFWMFTLINYIIMGALGYIDWTLNGMEMGMIYGLYSLAVLIPSLAVSVRRLQDTGKSGWMILVGLIPIIGGIWLLILFAKAGDIGDNAYGPDPKQSPGGDSGAAAPPPPPAAAAPPPPPPAPDPEPPASDPEAPASNDEEEKPEN